MKQELKSISPLIVPSLSKPDSDLIWYEAFDLSPKTTEDCFHYFLSSICPFSSSHLAYNPFGRFLQKGFFSTPSSTPLSEDLLSKKESLNGHLISFKKADETDLERPSLKFIHVPEKTTFDILYNYFSKFGKIEEFIFKENARFGYLIMSSALDYKNILTSRHILNGKQVSTQIDSVEAIKFYSPRMPTKIPDLATLQENSKIYVSSLGPNITEQDLSDFFSKMAEIGEVIIKEGLKNGKVNRYAFVELKKPEEALKILEKREFVIKDKMVGISLSSNNNRERNFRNNNDSRDRFGGNRSFGNRGPRNMNQRGGPRNFDNRNNQNLRRNQNDQGRPNRPMGNYGSYPGNQQKRDNFRGPHERNNMGMAQRPMGDRMNQVRNRGIGMQGGSMGMQGRDMGDRNMGMQGRGMGDRSMGMQGRGMGDRSMGMQGRGMGDRSMGMQGRDMGDRMDSLPRRPQFDGGRRNEWGNRNMNDSDRNNDGRNFDPRNRYNR